MKSIESENEGQAGAGMNRPLHSTIGIIALVPDNWSNIWQPRHHLMIRLAKYFHVLWIEPAKHWREVFKQKNPEIANNGKNETGTFHIHNPRFYPKFYRPAWLAKLSFNTRIRTACQWLKRRGCKTIVLYLWRPEFAPAIWGVTYDLACYHIDDEYSFSEADLPVTELEKRLIEGADIVFIHSKTLMQKKGGLNPNTLVVPNGVDFKAYAANSPEPTDLMPVPRPRIGYTGYLKKQLNWPLIIDMAEKHSQWSFVLVGARSPHKELHDVFQKLSKLPNAYLLGAKSVQELAAYPKHFDICIMPYLVNNYTKYIYPMKLHEYLASGRPVAGSQIPTLEDFKDVVYLCNDNDEWSKALSELLDPKEASAERVKMRMQIAKQHDWDLIAQKVARSILDRLA